ncbi:hypothetical protein I3760_13G081600 [Carya illinoinensis]|uniref:Secreted protein n=1 Tax=Carya illinoinensis TaxID=32201 RepID=A0A922AH80_CARIL|nr:hypothetical protein I3760_13G081600 [Carya illinoinensis]KAG6681229.1 hypothetical protein I3842_13G081700 [Carya illinoinensis]
MMFYFIFILIYLAFDYVALGLEDKREFVASFPFLLSQSSSSLPSPQFQIVRTPSHLQTYKPLSIFKPCEPLPINTV